VKAESYGYADDPAENPIPDELVMLGYVERFGAQAIYGRALSGKELRGMMLAENMVKAYRERQQASDWAKWAQDNPGKAAMLNEAMKLWHSLS